MHVLVTGASGFVGSKVVAELRAAGHAVTGLARSDASAAAIRALGAEVARGDLEAPETLEASAARADAVVHLAFDHDFSKIVANAENEQRAIAAIGDALVGTGKALVITSGTGLVDGHGRPAAEGDDERQGGGFPRAPEVAADAVAARGVRVAVVRLPQVHDPLRAGLVTYLVMNAREKGFAAYVGDGTNRWPAAHVSDVARLYRLALGKTAREAASPRAVRYHAIAEEGVPLRAIAEAIGAGLKLPVRSLEPSEAAAYFGWLGAFAARDLAATSEVTRRALDWQPTGETLLADLAKNEWAR